MRINHLKYIIDRYFKYYSLVFSTLFICLLIIYFSPHFGFGSGSSFLLYKKFGIFRSTIFFNLIRTLLFCTSLLVFLKTIGIPNSLPQNTNIIKKVSTGFYIIVIFIISCFSYLYKGYNFQFNAFEWTSFTNYPVIINNIYNGILSHDFFTNAIVETPRIFTIIILQLPTITGMNWYDGVYLYYVLNTIIYMPLLFICINSIINQFNSKYDSNIIKIIFAQFLVFILVWSKVIESIQHDKSLIGWSSALSTRGAEADEFSLLLGLLYLTLIFKNNFPMKNILCSVLLCLCVLIHVLYGLAIFSVAMLYYFSSREHYFDRLFLMNILLGIIPPVITLFLMFNQANPLSAEKFIEIYNLTTHAHHYKISQLIGWSFVNWFFCYLSQLILSVKMKDRFLIKLSLFSIAYFLIPTFIQFLGTEVWKIKTIGILGINRLSVFNSFIFCTNCLIIILRSDIFNKAIKYLESSIKYIQSEMIHHHTKIELFTYEHLKNIFLYFFSKSSIIGIAMAITLSTIWGFTRHDPLQNRLNINFKNNARNFPSLPLLCDWIKNHTAENSIFFIHDDQDETMNMPLSFAIRCFGHRATFTDYAFPFNESVLLEWQKRTNYYNNFDNLSIQSFLEISREYSITHLLITNHQPNKFEDFPSIWKSNEFTIYDLKSILDPRLISQVN